MARPHRKHEDPDGLVWRDPDKHCPACACAHCCHVAHYVGRDDAFAYRALARHLDCTHGLRHVWIDWFDHSVAGLVQLALPIVLDAETRARTRHLRSTR